jgi:signal transduction histidine kinase
VQLRSAGGVLAAVVGAAVTAQVVLMPHDRLAYLNPVLHAEIEAAAAVISLLVALLAFGRFRRTLLRGDLLVAAAFAVLGVANLLLSIELAAAANVQRPFAVWTPAVMRVIAGVLLAAAAWGPGVRVRRPDTAARQTLVACGAVTALVAVVVVALRRELSPAAVAAVSPGARGFHLLGGPGGVVALQSALVVAYGLAAVGFAVRRAPRDWFAASVVWAATLLAFAWIGYWLFSALYSRWIDEGDLLRVGAYVALAVGAASEIRTYQRDVGRLAVIQERGRLARELHDGLAQELVYLLGQARRLRRVQPSPEVDELLGAAERALDESRTAISAIRAPTDEPLAAALERTSRELERRLDMEIDVRLAPNVQVSDQVREAALRIVGEALANAARHGGARTATVELSEDDQLRLTVRDDGAGFDTTWSRRSGGSYGLLVMRERAEAVGARLDVRSAPGKGTEVEVILP